MKNKKSICKRATLAVNTARAHFSNLMYGTVPSRIKGPGFEYIDLREYSPGDDIRFIDWRASARMIKPDGDYRLMVKEHLLERLVNTVIVLDYSRSMFFEDKLDTAIYVLTGLLSIAHSLEDVIDLIIVYGEKPIVKYGMKPLEAVKFTINTICRIEPRGGYDLAKLANHLKKLRNREQFFIITDYAHFPVEYDILATTIKALNSSLALVLITSKYEVEQPVIDGYHHVADLESNASLTILLSQYYDLVKNHILKIESTLVKNRVPYIVLKGLRDAIVKKLRLVRLYSYTRLRRRAYF